MDKPILIIEAPELDDKTAIIVLDFLQDILNAFDAHFYYQRQQNRQLRHRMNNDEDKSVSDNNLF